MGNQPYSCDDHNKNNCKGLRGCIVSIIDQTKVKIKVLRNHYVSLTILCIHMMMHDLYLMMSAVQSLILHLPIWDVLCCPIEAHRCVLQIQTSRARTNFCELRWSMYLGGESYIFESVGTTPMFTVQAVCILGLFNLSCNHCSFLSEIVIVCRFIFSGDKYWGKR
jgi:hypothetical protein